MIGKISSELKVENVRLQYISHWTEVERLAAKDINRKIKSYRETAFSDDVSYANHWKLTHLKAEIKNSIDAQNYRLGYEHFNPTN